MVTAHSCGSGGWTIPIPVRTERDFDWAVLPGLDLCLTLYSVVPTEQDRGIIEFIQEAETVCRIQMAESCKNATGDISM